MKIISNANQIELQSHLNSELSTHLNELLSQGKVLFLVSGGSVTTIALQVLRNVKANFPNLTVSQIDERWAEDPMHAESNWREIYKTPEVSKLSKKGVSFHPILRGDDLEQTAKKYDKWLKKYVKPNIKIIGLFGIGDDGHTAGIFPCEPKLFHKRYLQEAFVVAHDSSPKSTPERITIIPLFIKEIHTIFIYATGEAKRPQLLLIKDKLDQKITDADIAKLPALALVTECSKFYTDQNI